MTKTTDSAMRTTTTAATGDAGRRAPGIGGPSRLDTTRDSQLSESSSLAPEFIEPWEDEVQLFNAAVWPLTGRPAY